MDDIQFQPVLLIIIRLKKNKFSSSTFSSFFLIPFSTSSFSSSSSASSSSPVPPPHLVLLLLLHALHVTGTQDCFNFTNKFLFSKEFFSIQYSIDAEFSFILLTQILHSIYIYLLYYTLTLLAFVSVYCH